MRYITLQIITVHCFTSHNIQNDHVVIDMDMKCASFCISVGQLGMTERISRTTIDRFRARDDTFMWLSLMFAVWMMWLIALSKKHTANWIVKFPNCNLTQSYRHAFASSSDFYVHLVHSRDLKLDHIHLIITDACRRTTAAMQSTSWATSEIFRNHSNLSSF